jgi:branched-chain amino acid transport system permease protein
VLGGFVVGVVEVFLQGYLPESVAPYREAISLSIIIGLLVMRPDGLWPAQNVNRS